jgi:hypothetical protein
MNLRQHIVKIVRPLAGLKAREASGERPRGYVELMLQLGQLTPDGAHVEFTPEQWNAARLQVARMRRRVGLGDLAHRVFAPFAQLLKLDCLQRDADGNVTQLLRPDSPCAQRQARWNKIKL